MDDLIYTVAETAKLLKTNRARIYKFIKDGELPALNIGGMKIRRTAIEEFLIRLEKKEQTEKHD